LADEVPTPTCNFCTSSARSPCKSQALDVSSRKEAHARFFLMSFHVSGNLGLVSLHRGWRPPRHMRCPWLAVISGIITHMFLAAPPPFLAKPNQVSEPLTSSQPDTPPPPPIPRYHSVRAIQCAQHVAHSKHLTITGRGMPASGGRILPRCDSKYVEDFGRLRQKAQNGPSGSSCTHWNTILHRVS